MVLDEIGAFLATAGVGTLGTTLFLSTSAILPTGDGPYLSLIETGGSGPLRIQNTIGPYYQMPALQLVARASTFDAAHALARAAYNALAVVRNQTIGGVYYREINPLQEPFDLGLDDTRRARVAFNVICIKRPS